jgi:hypothetical protein
MEKLYRLEFDIMDITSILATFNNFGLKITNYYELPNTESVEFEGTYLQLKTWYQEYYDTHGEFEGYFESNHDNV